MEKTEKVIVLFFIALILAVNVMGTIAIYDLNDGRVLRAVSSIIQAGPSVAVAKGE